MLKNSKILITGGTGSFGKEFVKLTLKKFNPKKIIIFSRDEIKQWDMALEYQNNKNIQFAIGDVRDKSSLLDALNGVDYVVHAAATKIVPTAELNPLECIKTNVLGSINVIEACIQKNIKKVISLSTDKASNPINLYGASKLAADKLFLANDLKKRNYKTIFSVVRYGNVMGSRGSVIPFFYECFLKKKPITVTDKNMTRFMLTLQEAVELVWKALDIGKGGEIFVKKCPSIKIIDLAKIISGGSKVKIIGIRPGEKMHEQLIGEADAQYTVESKNYYTVYSPYHFLNKSFLNKNKKNLVDSNFVYSSENNREWMKANFVKNWIKNNYK
jgi:UDP-N-acetylglucosamine 4,6-dehydratase (inverting)